MDKVKKIWDSCKSQLIENIPQDGGLEKLEYYSENNNSVTLSVPSSFIKAIVSKNIKVIENTLSEKIGQNIKVDFIISNNSSEKPKNGLKNTQINKNVITFKNENKIAQNSRKSTLNKNYRLDNFIAGDNSSFAYNVATTVAKNPGSIYNPVLFYGGVGLGKTHLLEAIGNYIEENMPEKKVIYITAESFTNEFIEMVGKDTSAKNNFKKKYRKADVLLIDDIHFFEKKESTQEELFHIFNELYDAGNLIAFTCDRPIQELKDITERLKSRFSRGANIDLKPPSYETRMAIANQKLKNLNTTFSYEVLDYICQNIKTNVRDLEGAIITLTAVSKMTNNKITIEIAKEHLSNIISPEMLRANNFSINEVFSTVANYFSVPLVEIKAAGRNRTISIPRNIGIYIAYNYGKFTHTEIGTFLNKDHTSIGYTLRSISPKVEIDESLKKAIKEIEKQLDLSKQ